MKRIFNFIPIALMLCLNGLLEAQNLTQGEYFIDTDPGVGKGNAIAVATPADSLNFSFNVPLGSLSRGYHYLYARFKDADGTWGIANTAQFYVATGALNDSSSPQLNAAEYFIDIDPGLGKGTAIATTTADSINQSFTVPFGQLSAGFHRLYTRFRDTNGVWGISNTSQFYVTPVGQLDTSPPINFVEYFFDSDPGVGKGNSLTIAPQADSVNASENLSIVGLSPGVHRLYLRARYTTGVWGLYQTGDTAFSVCIPPSDTIHAGGPTTFCNGGSVILTSDTASTWSYQWQLNGMNLPADTNSTLLADSAGIYNVLVIDSGLCHVSDSISVTIDVPVVTLSGIPDSICTNAASISLTGGSPAGGSYSGSGISGSQLNPGIAAVGIDTIVYSYTDSNSCSNTAKATIDVGVCTGIAEVNNVEFTLYPNPTEGLLNIKGTGTNGDMLIEVHDVLGRLLYTRKITPGNNEFTESINLNISGGFYYLDIRTDSGIVFSRLISKLD